MLRSRAWLAAVALLCVGRAATAVGGEKVFRAGAAAVDVNPREFPVRIVGGFLEGKATEIRDPLFARCLVLDDGEVRLAIVLVDNCLIPRDLMDDAKERASKATGIPTDHMLIAATHTHSGPAVVGVLGTDVDENYRKHLPGWIAESIETAVKNLAPARIGWTVVEDPEHVHCRRWIRRPDRIGTDPFGHATIRAMMHPGPNNPDYLGPSGPSDPDLSIVSVQSREGRPIALLANYGMHYVGAAPVSADYFGAFARKIAERLGAGDARPPFVGILSNGTSGDQWYMDYGKPRKEHTANSMGDALSGLAAEACRKIAYRDWVPLTARERTLKLAVRPIPDADFAKAKEAFEKVGERKPQTFEEVYPREQVLMSRMPSMRELKLQALRIGDLGIAAIPCEVFAITGLKIKSQSPLAQTFTIELANGYDGYIAPPEQHALGGYTTWRARSSCLEVEAEPKILAVVLELLEAVAGKPRRTVTDEDFPFGGYPQAVLASKPLAYWRLNEFSGPHAADAGPGNNHAEYVGNVAYFLAGPAPAGAVAGARRANRAPQLAGGHIKATIPGLGDKYTVEMWFYNCMPGDARGLTGYLFARSAGGASPAAGDRLAIGGRDTAAGKLVFLGKEPGDAISGSRAISVRAWHHAVFTRDGARVSAYLDGTPAPELAGDAGTDPATLGDTLLIGSAGDDLFTFEGRVDEVAVYARALSSEEVATHYATAVRP